MNKKFGFMVAAAVLISALPLSAHHAFTAEFDSNKPVKLRGTVAKVDMVNPHSWIYIDVKNQDGTTTQWMVEGGSPNALVRHGFTKNSLPKGTEVIFEGFQAKDGSNRANGRDIQLADGKKLFLGSSGDEAPPETKK
ncbi:MAG TPA: DUF6152 family protein [Bryobacteraceae bacterium]|jgi:hypothetical protein|nr:DUF6152 family protein [Bryobacteraceae bacterium]